MEAILPARDVPTSYVSAMHNIDVLYQCIRCDDNNQSINSRGLKALLIKVVLFLLTFNSREFMFLLLRCVLCSMENSPFVEINLVNGKTLQSPQFHYCLYRVRVHMCVLKVN